MARLYLDECVPLPLAPLLTQHGHDVTTAMQLGLRKLNDPFHFKYAVEQNRILITTNQSDFRLLHRFWITMQSWNVMMPEAILKHFANGHHISKIIELPPEAIQWGSRHLELTEATQGKYDINERGVFIEKSTGTWPRYYPGGFPFAHIDPNDPQAAYKIIYNFFNRGGPIDDIDLFLNMFWVNETGLDRYIDFVGQVLIYGSRWTGPIPNPEEVAAKVLVYGAAPYDVVGLATLRWAYLDPDKWSSLWAYIPTIRRVRRLAAANSSDGVFGSHWSLDDGSLFSGKIHYFTWKLVGSQEALVPYTLPTPKYWEKTDRGLLLPANENAAIMPWPGKSKLFDQSGQSWAGATWWPTNMHITKRPVWILEITAKDPYYGYGKQYLWMDKELFRAYYKEVYNRAGEYWKTFLLGGGIALTRDNVFSTLQADYALAIDEHSAQTNVVLPLREGYDIRVNVGLEPDRFDYQNLSKAAK